MEHLLQNGSLSVTVAEAGAELRSVRDGAGTEYLWQRDKTFWGRTSPMLFPFVGRLAGGEYTLSGRRYALGTHGFARDMDFVPVQQGAESLSLRLEDTPETRAAFPFPFRLERTYRLEGRTLSAETAVENTGEETMYFGLGAHPGFALPLEPGRAFSDYDLSFPEPSCPTRVEFTAAGYRTGRELPFALEGERRLPLTHALFDDEAVVLRGTPREVKLAPRDGAGKGLIVRFPQAPYVGFWHPPHTEAPFVCIEPWCTLPGRENVTEDLAHAGLLSLAPGETFRDTWSIEIL